MVAPMREVWPGLLRGFYEGRRDNSVAFRDGGSRILFVVVPVNLTGSVKAISQSCLTGKRRDKRPAGNQRVLPKFEIDRGCLAPLTLFDLERDFLAFRQGRLSRPLDRRDMDEDVLRSIIRLDEAIALLSVEPFNCTVRHILLHYVIPTHDLACRVLPRR